MIRSLFDRHHKPDVERCRKRDRVCLFTFTVTSKGAWVGNASLAGTFWTCFLKVLTSQGFHLNLFTHPLNWWYLVVAFKLLVCLIQFQYSGHARVALNFTKHPLLVAPPFPTPNICSTYWHHCETSNENKLQMRITGLHEIQLEVADDSLAAWA